MRPAKDLSKLNETAYRSLKTDIQQVRGPQRPKNLGSREALLPGKFLRV